MESGGGVRKKGSKSGVIYRQTPPEARSSSLATISLFAGILSFLGLIGVGGIVAIVSGTMALRRIKLSGGKLRGRKLAKLGRLLGIINLAVVPLVIAAYLTWRATAPSFAPIVKVATETPRLGVKRKVELQEEDFVLLEKTFGKLDPATASEPAEEIIAAYFGERRSVNPEVALLTTKRIEHSDGSPEYLSFALKDVDPNAAIEVNEDRGEESRRDDADLEKEASLKRYSLKIKNKNNLAIWIQFFPPSEGPGFRELLFNAAQAARPAR